MILSQLADGSMINKAKKFGIRKGFAANVMHKISSKLIKNSKEELNASS